MIVWSGILFYFWSRILQVIWKGPEVSPSELLLKIHPQLSELNASQTQNIPCCQDNWLYFSVP